MSSSTLGVIVWNEYWRCLRDILLPKLMNGETRAMDTEKSTENII